MKATFYDLMDTLEFLNENPQELSKHGDNFVLKEIFRCSYLDKCKWNIEDTPNVIKTVEEAPSNTSGVNLSYQAKTFYVFYSKTAPQSIKETNYITLIKCLTNREKRFIEAIRHQKLEEVFPNFSMENAVKYGFIGQEEVVNKKEISA